MTKIPAPAAAATFQLFANSLFAPSQLRKSAIPYKVRFNMPLSPSHGLKRRLMTSLMPLSAHARPPRRCGFEIQPNEERLLSRL